MLYYGNAIIEAGDGALFGVLLGWFIAAAVFEQKEKDKEDRVKGKSIK
jgi:hypothetical protein